MDRRIKNSKSSGKMTTNRLYMDLREILREEALRYLPAKALHRFLTVCRDWKLQISTPFFIHNQSVSFRSVSGIFIQSRGNPPSFISLDEMAYGVPDQELKFLPEPVDVRASSNGLLCCQGRNGNKAYYVCNPVNQQWKQLPKPTADHGTQPALILAFEPSALNFFVDYKVVCVFASTDIEQGYEFEIYSSVQDSWKVSAEMYFVHSSLQIGSGIYVSGVAYWPIRSGTFLTFNVKTEKATEVKAFGYGAGHAPSLGTMNGKLCSSSIRGLSVTVNVMETRHANTMPMQSRAKLWQRTLQFQLNPAIKSCGCVQSQVLLIWNDVILVKVGTKVYSYDAKTQKTTTLHGETLSDDHYTVFPYVNSLVSLI